MLRPLPTLVPRVLLGNDYGQKDSGKKFALLTNNTNQFFFFSYSMALILKSSLLNVMRSPTILGLLFLIFFYPRPTYLLSSHCHVNIYIQKCCVKHQHNEECKDVVTLEKRIQVQSVAWDRACNLDRAMTRKIITLGIYYTWWPHGLACFLFSFFASVVV